MVLARIVIRAVPNPAFMAANLTITARNRRLYTPRKYTIPITENLGTVSETITPITRHVRTISESLGSISETLAKSAKYIRAISDRVGTYILR